MTAALASATDAKSQWCTCLFFSVRRSSRREHRRGNSSAGSCFSVRAARASSCCPFATAFPEAPQPRRVSGAWPSRVKTVLTNVSVAPGKSNSAILPSGVSLRPRTAAMDGNDAGRARLLIKGVQFYKVDPGHGFRIEKRMSSTGSCSTSDQEPTRLRHKPFIRRRLLSIGRYAAATWCAPSYHAFRVPPAILLPTLCRPRDPGPYPASGTKSRRRQSRGANGGGAVPRRLDQSSRMAAPISRGR